MPEKQELARGETVLDARVDPRRPPSPGLAAAPAVAAAREAADLLAAQVPDEALAVGDNTAAPAHQAARLARVAGPVRRTLLGRLQQQRGNAYVQRVMRHLRSGPVQRAGSTGAARRDDVARRIEAASAGGSPLAPGLAQEFGARLDSDLTNVRVHTGPEADALNQAVDAVAFTSGQNVFFSQGAYAPQSAQGRHLLAHELAHTVQQAAGPVAGKPAPGGVALSDPGDAFEQAAEAAATAAVGLAGSGAGAPPLLPAAAIGQPAAIQRQPEPALGTEHAPELGEPTPITLSDDDQGGGIITIDEQGVTNCAYNPPSLKTKDEKVTDVGNGLVDISGTIVAAFKATITVNLPTVPDGLSACQRKRVQDAIDKKLKPHEDQHVAAFEKYNGVYEAPCEAKGVPRAKAIAKLVAAGKAVVDAEGARRKQEAQDASDALDKPPFIINVDLDCDDKQKLAAGDEALPSGGSGEGGEGEETAVQMVQRFARGQRLWIDDEAVEAPAWAPAENEPEPGSAAVLAQAEQSLGYDLSAVALKHDSAAAAAAGAEALTVGRKVYLAPGTPGPDTPHGAHVLAHELAHVVQQSRGETAAMGPGRYDALEAQAEAQARQSRSTPAAHPPAGGLRALPDPAYPAAQAFDPRYHRQSLVEGMAGSGFSPDEIGLMYAANWERDFSQAHPALAAVVLAWKGVKLAASQGNLTEAETGAFEGAVNNVVGMIPFQAKELADGRAYGGYNFFEHMDNPTGDPNMAAETRNALLLKPSGESIPQYMVDSREYIKAQLFRAAMHYRGDMSASSASGQTAAAFARRQQELRALHQAETPNTTSTSAAGAVGQETAAQVRGMPVTTIEFPADRITAPAPAATGPGGEMIMPADTVHGQPPGAAAFPTSGPAFHTEVDRRFWQQTNYKVGQRLDPAVPEDRPYIQIWLRIRDQVRTEREAQNATAARERAQAARPPNGPGPGGAAAPPANGAAPQEAAPAVARPGNFTADVADAMGRASHALEDFFSHSNFVEIAIGEAAPGADLNTATFTANDSTHALAHKIRGAADEIEAEMPLVNRIAGRSEETPAPADVNIGSAETPVHEDEDIEDIWDVVGEDVPAYAGVGAAVGGVLGVPFGPAGIAGGAVVGGAIGGFLGLEPEVREAVVDVGGRAAGGAILGGLAGAVAGLVTLGPAGVLAGGLAGMVGGGILGLRSGIKAMARNVIATPAGVGLLRRAAELLEESSRAKAAPGSHTAQAKDQPSHEDDAFGRLKTIKFQLAQELAAAADAMILGPMRQVLDAATPEAADALLQDIYKKLNGLIATPGSGHALAPLIDRRRDEAVQALEESRRAGQ
ncbi:MAG: DUF4157 domain-containing protein [Anaerolineales bacterium]|nr:DUF4157 domain-containing protein [Anaerolineales bacterium]